MNRLVLFRYTSTLPDPNEGKKWRAHPPGLFALIINVLFLIPGKVKNPRLALAENLAYKNTKPEADEEKSTLKQQGTKAALSEIVTFRGNLKTMNEMVKTVDMKTYRRIYMNFLAMMTAMAVAVFMLVQKGIYIPIKITDPDSMTNILLIGMVALAFGYGYILRKLRAKLLTIADFEEKMAFHRKYFKIKMWWNILSGATSCFLYLLTGNRFFFWFVLFDFLSMLLSSPRQFFFKRELNDDDIIFL